MKKVLGLVCVVAFVAAWAIVAPSVRAEDRGDGDHSLDDLAFLAGAWAGDALGGRCEETWSAPAGGGMMGMFRLVHGDKTFVYEFLLIEETDEGVALRFRHVSPGWEIWEQDVKLPPVLELEEIGDGYALFVAPTDEHTPGAIEYRREGNTLQIAVMDRARSDEGALRLELELTD